MKYQKGVHFIDRCTIPHGLLGRVVCEVSGALVAFCFRVAKLRSAGGLLLRRNYRGSPWRGKRRDAIVSSRYCSSSSICDVLLGFRGRFLRGYQGVICFGPLAHLCSDF